MRNLLLFLLYTFLYTPLPGQSSRQANISPLFVVTDKTLYTPGETIWFNGYFLPQEMLPDSLQPDIMSVGLIRQDTTGFAINQNYLMQDNLCAGSLALPLGLRAGSYEMVAAINLLESTGMPRFVFRKRITVQSMEQPPFLLLFQVDSSLAADTLHISMQASVTDLASSGKKNNSISYHRPGNKPQTQKLDITGRATFKIPVNRSDTTMPVLYTLTSFNGHSLPYTVWLPYQIKPDTSPPDQYKVASTATTHMILTEKVIEDTLEVTINTSVPQNLVLSRKSLYSDSIEDSETLPVSTQKKLLLPMHDASRGIQVLSLKNDKGQLLDEQPFFAHYSERHKLELTIAKETVSTREKISLTIDLKDLQGDSATAILTIYCVDTNRLEVANQLPFYNSYYHGIFTVPKKPNSSYAYSPMQSNTHKLPLNVMPRPLFAIEDSHKPVIEGHILLAEGDEGTKVKKRMALFIHRDSIISIVSTDSNGTYRPQPQDIVVREGRLFSIKAGSLEKTGDQRNAAFAVKLTNPMKEPMDYLQKPGLPFFVQNQKLQNSSNQILKGHNQSITMQNVTVLGKRNRTNEQLIWGNNCGDYVCINEVLNCESHLNDKNNKLPVKGERYKLSRAGRYELYLGCTENYIERINTARLFTGMDKDKLQQKALPQYLTTLYWSPAVFIHGAYNLSFFSSDLAGRYKIIAEGVAENGDILYAEKEIVVMEPVED